MSVELWYGQKPTNAGEQNVLIELYDFLKSRQRHYVMISNFHAGCGHETDLLILKEDGVFLAELKHYWDKVVGSKDGPWVCHMRNGGKMEFGNPYRQIMQCGFDWQDWCEQTYDALRQIAGVKRDLNQYRAMLYIVFYPDLNPKSEINIDAHPVQAVGLDKFRTILAIRSNAKLNFSREELSAIPTLLPLTRWHIDPPEISPETVKIEGDNHPPVVRMLVPRNPDPVLKLKHIERGLITIGRDPSCDLSINDESISRNHAEISRDENYWVVTDLDSLNGTFVSYNGDPETERRVEGRNALKNGSIVRFGEISYTVILDE